MKIEELIQEFNRAAGLEEVPAADGVWKFSADGAVFGVSADEAGEKVYLFGEIPSPVPDKEDAFRKTMLEANYFFNGTGGATFSINPETGAYTLIAAERLDRLAPESFFAFVEKFVNTLATWKAIALSAEASPTSSDSGESAAREPDDGGLDRNRLDEGGFLRV